jgi:hypothetical protein
MSSVPVSGCSMENDPERYVIGLSEPGVPRENGLPRGFRRRSWWGERSDTMGDRAPAGIERRSAQSPVVVPRRALTLTHHGDTPGAGPGETSAGNARSARGEPGGRTGAMREEEEHGSGEP